MRTDVPPEQLGETRVQPSLCVRAHYISPAPIQSPLIVPAASLPQSPKLVSRSTGGRRERLRELCPLNDWEEVLAAATPDEQLAERLRQATRTGRPLGSSEFISALEGRLQRTLARQKPGPAPPKPLAAAAKTSYKKIAPIYWKTS